METYVVIISATKHIMDGYFASKRLSITPSFFSPPSKNTIISTSNTFTKDSIFFCVEGVV